MATKLGTCKLCLRRDKKFVDSHIIPAAFYEQYRAKTLIAFSEKSDFSSRINKGLYGNFLCLECEKKLERIDDKAIKVIKKGEGISSVASNQSNQEILLVENAFLIKDDLHKFALSVLWRAQNSGRKEYNAIKIGSYQEEIRLAIFNEQYSQNLLDATGLMLWEFRNSAESEADVVNYFYRTITNKNNKVFSENFGSFRVHVFGYPYGEILIRLGGEKPKQCSFQKVENLDKPSVLWSTSLSENFPNLVVMKTPRIRNDGNMVGTAFLKNIFSVITKQRNMPE